ncbi:MAG: hypothetical protein SFU20_00370 [Chitinophagaceae bacterium]|nr:hypothetical protein [Chitinophagaceae bacterium]
MRYILSLFLFISLSGYGQYKSYITGVRGDTLNIVDLNGKKQGRWVNTVQPLRGEPGYEEQGVYVNDLKEGRWQQFYLTGDIQSIENYKWGNKHGKCFYYNRWGALVREESWKSVNPENPYDTVAVYDIDDPTRIVDHVVVKLEGTTLRHGTWKYYDPDFGTIEKTEEYVHDKLKNGLDELAPIDVRNSYKPTTDSLGNKATPKPKTVLEFEKKNSGKKAVKVRDGKTGG